MNKSVNKDLLITVMSQRQAELDKLVKLQSSQLENYRIHVEGFKALVTSYEKQIAEVDMPANYFISCFAGVFPPFIAVFSPVI